MAQRIVLSNLLGMSKFIGSTRHRFHTSASIPKSISYFLEKSVIVGSIQKASFMTYFGIAILVCKWGVVCKWGGLLD
ncbi:hypothetical protein [Methanosarcina vacuolata]|uniref:hypothetical protein n=1 Tax=Methanosarcina vacuolata TaxID=2215 RepID=UPI000A953CA5|nr:hypothetical protein [Methanosarcina vacuolata]